MWAKISLIISAAPLAVYVLPLLAKVGLIFNPFFFIDLAARNPGIIYFMIPQILEGKDALFIIQQS